MQVSKWGNSLAIRLPASVVEVLGLKEGDDIEIHVAGARFRDQEDTRSPRTACAPEEVSRSAAGRLQVRPHRGQ
jgi:antitoxin MazE